MARVIRRDEVNPNTAKRAEDLTTEAVICLAHPMTVGQYREMEEKGLGAFKIATLSNRAKREGAYMGGSTGSSITTSASTESKICVKYLCEDGRIIDGFAGVTNYGLRIGLHPNYNPFAKIVKSCETVTKKARVQDGKNLSAEGQMVTSTGKVVTVGGIKYLWINEEECMRGVEEAMNLVSVDVVACAAPYPESSNNFADATKLQQQCEEIALENCDKEELELLQEAMLAKEDKYEIPIALERVRDIPDAVKSTYQQIRGELLTAEEGREELKTILAKISHLGAEAIQKFTKTLETEHAAHVRFQEEKQAAKDSTRREHDKAAAKIDGLVFGGDK